MGAKKLSNSWDGSATSFKESVDLPSTRASFFQLYRYTSQFDRLLLLVASLVAVVTGASLPFLAILMGNTTQNFMTSMSEMTLPLFKISKPFRDAVYHNMTTEVSKNCVIFAEIGAGVFVAGWIQAVCFLIASENMVNKLRQKFFKAILRQEVAWFDKNNSGSLATKLFDNLERVKEGTGDKVGLCIQFTSQFITSFVIAFTYDWKLTLIMLSVVPFLIICGGFLGKWMSSAAQQEAKKYSIAGGIAEEVLTCIRTVMAFNGQEYEHNRYDQALANCRKVGTRKSFFIGIGLGATFFFLFTSFWLAFYLGTNYVADNRLDGGDVVTIFFSVTLGALALGQSGPQFATVGTALGSAGSLYEIIDRVPEIDSYEEGGQRPVGLKGHITVENVKFTYPTRPDVPILKGLSFDAKPGQTIALVGSSGCGKSTIIQLLLRYYNQESGKILIDGIEIRDINIEFLRNYIGVVSQEPNLFNTTIEQNIRYGREDITDGQITAALRNANAYNFVMGFSNGLQTLVGDRGSQMSGGQKQRIAIARALVRDPKVLLLDEATSALDSESEHIVQQALEKASIGRTTIVIAHRLATIKNADQIIVMKAGEVVETGKHNDLLEKKGLYHDLVHAQVFTDIDENGTPSDKKRHSMDRQNSQGLKRLTSHKGEDSEQRKDDPKLDMERLKLELEDEGVQKVGLFGIMKYARPEWIHIFVGFLACCVQGCVFPALSIVFAQMIKIFSYQKIDPNKVRHDGHQWAFVFLFLGAIQFVTMFLQCALFGLAAERLTMRLRSMAFRNVLRQDAPYFDNPKHSVGKITTRLATDAPNVKFAIDYRLGSVIASLVTCVCAVSISFYFGWQMACLAIFMYPICGIGQGLQIYYFSGGGQPDAKELENSGKIAIESIENIRTVQALTLQKRLLNQFADHLSGPLKKVHRQSIWQGLAYGFATAVFYFVFSGLFRFSVYLITHSPHMDPLDAMRVLFAVSFTSSSVALATAYFPDYAKARFAAGLIFKMMTEEPSIDSMTLGGSKPTISGHVQLKDIHFRYPERPNIPILQGLDVEVKPGQTLALVGPSGCGKSTVISLMERFYDPANGSVTVDSHDLRGMNPYHLRSHIALVSQEPILFDKSIRENIIYGLAEDSVEEKEILAAAEKANIHKFVSALPEGYNTRVGDKGTQLSGGQKQRIAIARALIRNPKILLLDEATSALDTESEKVVQEALDKASEGRTCIVIAHRLSTIVNADCIMVVKNGVVVEKGTHNELVALKGVYYSLTLKQGLAVMTGTESERF